MEKNRDLTPVEYVKDGKFTRRTFVKGAGWITITSALGFGLAGCAPNSEPKADKETTTPADPNEGVTYAHACCNLNCTSHCHLKAHIKDGTILTVTPGDTPGREDYANACLRGMALSQKTQDENARVMYPMKRTGERGSGEFERISWDQPWTKSRRSCLRRRTSTASRPPASTRSPATRATSP
ncbi:hypothetical protein [Eggerthella sinensis]|uniref:hypothetical protein n=1 Tax=Eggerthella sinensis TaxID=242230 RepID=UPI0022E22619|nr:hypothetical protein [Eggerthella sinensis]